MKLLVYMLSFLLALTASPAYATTSFMESGSDATQDVKMWAAMSGTCTSSTTTARTGPRSITCGAGALNSVSTATGTLADAGRRITQGFRMSALPGATGTIMASQTSGLSVVIRVRMTTGGVLQIWHNTAQLGSNGSTLSINTWYRITFSYVVTSTTNFSAKVFVNGVQDISVTQADGTLGITSTSIYGTGNINGAASFVMFFDDTYIDTGTGVNDIGNISVTNKRPNANGTTNGWIVQIGAGGSGYG